MKRHFWILILMISLATSSLTQQTTTPTPTEVSTKPAATLTQNKVAEIPQATELAPTRTLRPTITPPEEIPTTDTRFLHSMILFGVLSVIVILLGVWINRERIDSR